MPEGFPVEPFYHFKTHGGLGDLLWVYKRTAHLDHPIFLSISEENRARPRRSGILADHLPRVIGWRFDGETFAPGGQDWTPATDPCCLIGKTWKELGFKPNTAIPYKVECNRWLEAGNRIEGWLPDIPVTAHRIQFQPSDPPDIRLKPDYVVFHLAGWPDVSDQVWRSLITLFRLVCHVYVVGGSYDIRPRAIVNALGQLDSVTLLEDLSWPNLLAVIQGARYVFGHASGFTALADVLGKRGVINNPRYVPRLVNTWNDLTNRDLFYAANEVEFESAVYEAYQVVTKEAPATWPPHAAKGKRVCATTTDPGAAIESAARTILPRSIATFADEGSPAWLSASAIKGAYDNGCLLDVVHLVNPSADSLAAVYRESARSTRRALIQTYRTSELEKSRISGVDLAVVYVTADPSTSFTAATDMWRRLSYRGAILLGGPMGDTVVSSLAKLLKIEPGTVDNAHGWFYIHKRR